jgi:hypothetical protein
MSSDLSTELSTLRTLIITAKDDITRLRDSYDPTALATVMGPAQANGIMDREVARTLCSEHSVLGALLASCTDKDATTEAIAGLMVHSAYAASERVCDEAVRLAQGDLATELDLQVGQLTRSMDLITNQAASIILEAEARANVVTAARAEALRIYNQSWIKTEEASSIIKGLDARLVAVDAQSAALVMDSTLTVKELSKGCESLDKATKFVKYQREQTIGKLAENFGHRKIKSPNTPKITLRIPASLDVSKGKQAIQSIRTYTTALSEQFAFIMAELERTDSDYDQKTQSFYKPPSIPAEIDRIPVDSRELHTADASTLYDEVWVNLSSSTQARLRETFNYGFGASKLTGTVTEGDGVTLVFALLSFYLHVQELCWRGE